MTDQERKKFSVRVLEKREYERWDQLVSVSSHGSVYAFSPYLTILCQATNGCFSILGVFSGDELIGGLPLYKETRRFGEVISNRLLLHYNGIIIEPPRSKYPSADTSRALGICQGLEEYLQTIRSARLLLHQSYSHSDSQIGGTFDARVFLSKGWHVSPRYTYVLEFENMDEALGKVDKNLRRLIRKAEDAGCKVQPEIEAEEFYQLHEALHLRKGSPLYLPREKFLNYVAALRKEKLGTLFGVRTSSGMLVAGQLVLFGPRGKSASVCAATSADYIWTSAFLRLGVCGLLRAQGISENDLTDASLNSVTRFKCELGATLRQTIVITRPDSLLCRFAQWKEKWAAQNPAD